MRCMVTVYKIHEYTPFCILHFTYSLWKKFGCWCSELSSVVSLWPLFFLFDFFYPSTGHTEPSMPKTNSFCMYSCTIRTPNISLSPSHFNSDSFIPETFGIDYSAESVPLSHASPFGPHSMRRTYVCLSVLCEFINYTIYIIRMINVWAYMYASIFLFISFLISVSRHLFCFIHTFYTPSSASFSLPLLLYATTKHTYTHRLWLLSDRLFHRY